MLKSQEAIKYYRSLNKYEPISLNNYIIVNKINKEIKDNKEKISKDLKVKTKKKEFNKEIEKSLVELKDIYG